MSSIPANPSLYKKITEEAKQKFKVWPSAYASGWLVKEYKRRGGTYKKKKAQKSISPLARWYEEQWINVCQLPKIVPCGRSKSSWEDYPYCRPRKRISPETPKTAEELSPTQIKERCKTKKKNPKSRII